VRTAARNLPLPFLSSNSIGKKALKMTPNAARLAGRRVRVRKEQTIGPCLMLCALSVEHQQRYLSSRPEKDLCIAATASVQEETATDHNH